MTDGAQPPAPPEPPPPPGSQDRTGPTAPTGPPAPWTPPAPWVPPVAQPVAPPVIVPLVAPAPVAEVQGGGPADPFARARVKARRDPTMILVLSVAGVVFAGLVVTLVALFASLLSTPRYDPGPAVRAPEPEVTPHEPTTVPPTAPAGGPDQTLTTEHGVSITVETPSCYSRQGSSAGEVERRCSVPVRVSNDGPEQIKISAADFGLFFGDTRYAVSSGDSLFFGEPRSGHLDPSTHGLVLLWFDVPPDLTEPTRLEFRRQYVVDTTLTVVFGAPDTPPPAEAAPAPGADVGPLGTTLRPVNPYSDTAVALTVHSVECGLREAPDDPRPIEPEGEFCAVTATFANEGFEEAKVAGVDFMLLIGDERVTTSSSANRFDYQRRSAWVDPRQSIECTLYFDVPVGTVPTGVRYAPYNDGSVTFTVP